jgi:threonine dehydrogenase-like Zn-dependent dehydrogenase
MKAVAVFPGKPNSIHLTDLPEPSVDDIPDGRGILVEVLRVGVDGTDKEINDVEYGDAPEGYDLLVTGHKSFGRVLEVGPNVRSLALGDYVVATVRRPGSSIYDRIGTYDMTTDETYYERVSEEAFCVPSTHRVERLTYSLHQHFWRPGPDHLQQSLDL